MGDELECGTLMQTSDALLRALEHGDAMSQYQCLSQGIHTQVGDELG
jgi:hypothetical protein